MKTNKPAFVLFFLFVFLFSSFAYSRGEKQSDGNSTTSKLYNARVFKDINITFGPILVREKYEDWSKELKDVGGAYISYTNDRAEDTGIWQSKGALIYPISTTYHPERNSDDWERLNYIKLALLPTIKWNRQADMEVLSFYLPVDYAVSHNVYDSYGNLKGLATKWRDDYYFSLSYMTDFDFEGAMINVEFTYEPTVKFGQRFQIGSWHGLMDNGNKESTEIVYLLRIIPGLTYSRVLSESAFFDREENDNLLGVTGSVELRLKLLGRDSPWDIYGKYDFLYDFAGDSSGYADRWDAGATCWINENVGLDLNYEKGDIALTNKEVDLVTLKLKLRI